VAKHGPPLLFGTVDEGVPSAAADAGIGETAVDPAERFQRAAIADLTEAGSLTSHTPVCTLPEQPAMVAAALLFFSALRPQIETLHPAAAKRLRDAETDAAVTAGDDGHPAGEVEYARKRFHGAFPFVWRALGRASDGGQMFLYQPWTRRP